jgi:excisionase family DNA binding protein
MKDSANLAAYGVDDFCEAHGIGRTTFYAEVAAGRIRPVKAGRRTLVPASEGQRWLESLPPMEIDQGLRKATR